MNAKIYSYVDGHEIHMIGNDVAVVWNADLLRKEIVKDGITYTALVPVRTGEPYIDFVWLRTSDDGEVYKDEDSVGRGGMSAPEALSLSCQLADAVEYLKALTK